MKIEMIKNETMAAHTTWQIGGPTKYYAQVTDPVELGEALAIASDLNAPVFMIGNGSNLLVGDKGFDGMVIKLRGNFTGLHIKHNVIVAEAGVKLATIVNVARERSLEGMAFAAGIPGTVGGAVVMNAGALDGSISDIIETVTIYNPQGEVGVLGSTEFRFGYRVTDVKNKGIVLGASFRLEQGDPHEVTRQIVDALDRKRRTQPLEARTAGSVFKNPPRKHAAALIEEAGCKGMKIGGAVVSRMHANFIINVGGATAYDVLRLIDEVAATVKNKTGVELEREVELVGEF
ncbi:MAG: UDP-N-acetylmuramate dehydrogenase [Actinomycetota bacterium]